MKREKSEYEKFCEGLSQSIKFGELKKLVADIDLSGELTDDSLVWIVQPNRDGLMDSFDLLGVRAWGGKLMLDIRKYKHGKKELNNGR